MSKSQTESNEVFSRKALKDFREKDMLPKNISRVRKIGLSLIIFGSIAVFLALIFGIAWWSASHAYNMISQNPEKYHETIQHLDTTLKPAIFWTGIISAGLAFCGLAMIILGIFYLRDAKASRAKLALATSDLQNDGKFLNPNVKITDDEASRISRTFAADPKYKKRRRFGVFMMSIGAVLLCFVALFSFLLQRTFVVDFNGYNHASYENSRKMSRESPGFAEYGYFYENEDEYLKNTWRFSVSPIILRLAIFTVLSLGSFAAGAMMIRRKSAGKSASDSAIENLQDQGIFMNAHEKLAKSDAEQISRRLNATSRNSKNQTKGMKNER